MKKLLITIVVLVVASLIAPKFIGNLVETEYQSVLEKIAENPSITINSSTYTQGWFNGKVTTDMTILLHDDEVDDIKLIVEDHLSFGPVIFTDSGIKFALSYSQAEINFKELLLDEEIADFVKDKVHFTGLLTFSKDVVTTIVIDEISEEVDGNKVTSAKAVGEFVLENNNRIYGEFNWDGLTAITSEDSFSVGKTSFSLDQTLVLGDYYQGTAISTGDFNLAISSININDAMGNEVLLLKQLAIGAIASVDNELMKMSINYGAEEVKSAGQHLKNANIDVVLGSIDINVMQEINTLFASISTNEAEMFNEQNMEKISPLVTKLLARDPILKIKDLSVDTPEGKIQSAMQMTIDKDAFDVNNVM
ncbi:MAG: YdgA family protein, partial [Colwellia sp.]|nr:YdgA family protein [Colwellia sp.]